MPIGQRNKRAQKATPVYGVRSVVNSPLPPPPSRCVERKGSRVLVFVALLSSTGLAYARPTQVDARLAIPVGGAEAVVMPRQQTNGSTELPNGERVVSGSAHVVRNGTTMTIKQQSQRSVLDWRNFSIGRDASVHFDQGGPNGATLNRVSGGTTSIIAGSLTATGHVYLINPNGIVVTSTGEIDVGSGFVASTLDISNDDFENGRARFSANGSSSSVINNGFIRAGEGGYVALLGPTVENQGVISVKSGKIGIGAGERATLDLYGDGFLQVGLSEEFDGLAVVAGNINAGSGMVEVRASVVKSAFRDVVNLPTSVSARHATVRASKIVFDSGGGTAAIGGRLDASNADGVGGAIQLGGRSLSLADMTANVQGTEGGGSITVGGGRKGVDVQGLTRAERLLVAESAIFDASATANISNAGDVTLWSDHYTNFRGVITARAIGGRGGEVEVSSAGKLVYAGLADLRGGKGLTGNLLIDPYNITISSGANTGAGFTANADNTNINPTTLANALATANVTVSTGSSGSQAGNITVANAVNWASGNQLTLNAANNIVVNAGLTASGGGGIQLTAGNQIDLNNAVSVGGGIGNGVVIQANGSIVSGSGASITTQGQAITLNADRDANGTGSISLVSSAVTSHGGAIVLGGGSNPLTTAAYTGASHGIDLRSATITSSGGAISIRGAGSASGTFGIYSSGTTAINSGAGSITLAGTGGGVASNAMGVDWTAGSLTSTSGAIGITGTGGGTSVGTVNRGIDYRGSITSTSGTINLSGTAVTGTNHIDGLFLGNAMLTTAGGIALSGGTISAAAPSTNGVEFSGATIQSTGIGTIIVNATALNGNTALEFFSTSTVAASTGGVTLNTNSININSGDSLSGTGNLTIQPITASTTIGLGNSAVGTLNLDAGELSRLTNGFSGITIGSATGTGAVDVRVASFLDPVTIRTPTGAGSITVNGALSTGSGTSAGSITLQAGNGISFASGSSLISQGQTVVLTGDADASGTGSVTLVSSSLATNGGNLTVTGSQTGTGTAITLTGATLNLGTGTGTLAGSSTNGHAIRISGATGLIANGGGSLTLSGTTSAGTIANAAGVYLAVSASLNTAGSVSLIGSGGTSGSTSALGRGITLDTTAAISSAGNLVLQGSTLGTSTSRDGLLFIGNNSLTSTSGNLTVIGLAIDNGQGLNQNSGTLTLNNSGGGSFSLTGTSLSGTGLRLGSNAGLSSNGNMSVQGNSTNLVGTLLDSGSTIAATIGNLTIGGTSGSDAGLQVRGSGTITQSGGGAIALSGTSTSYRGFDYFLGATRSAAGNVFIAGTATTGIGVNIDGGNGLTLSNGNVTISGTSIEGTGVVFNGAESLTNASTGTFKVAGTSGSGIGLSLNAGATLTTSGTIDFSGNSTSAIGMVLASTSTVSNSSAARLSLGGFGGAGSIDLGATIFSGNGPLVLLATGAVAQSAGSITVGALQLLGAGGQFLLDSAGNSIAVLAGNTDSVQLVTSGLLTVGTVGSVGLTTTGAVSLQTIGAEADVRLTQPISSSATSDAVVIVSGRNFINDVGAAGIVVGSGGRFLVYSADWAADTRGGLSAGNLYSRTYAHDSPTSISQAGSQFIYARQPVLTVAADAETRIYGDANPALTASIAGLVNGDTTGAAYSGVALLVTAATTTSNVGNFDIVASIGTLASEQGYGFQFLGANLAVTARPLTVTADALSRIYGNANPALTFTVAGDGLVNGDVLMGALATTAGLSSNAGAYAITQGSLVASTNYALSYTGADLTVSARSLMVTADALSRMYGNINPTLSFTVVGQGLVNGDALTGALTTSAGLTSNVGTYLILRGTLAATSNYVLTYNGANLAVTARPLTVTADALSRMYGNANPALTFIVAGQGLVNGNTLTGALATSASLASNVGSYAIMQGSLAAGSNYTLNYVGADLTILKLQNDPNRNLPSITNLRGPKSLSAIEKVFGRLRTKTCAPETHGADTVSYGGQRDHCRVNDGVDNSR